MNPTPNPDPSRYTDARDVAPLGPVHTIDIAPATLTYVEDGLNVHHPAVVLTFVKPDAEAGHVAVCPPIIVPVEVLHEFDTRYLHAAGEAIRLAELGNTGGDVALAADVAGTPVGGLYKYRAGDDRTEFLAGSAADGERATGILRRSTCTLCGIAIFADVADRGACLSCDPELDDDKVLDPPPFDHSRTDYVIRCESGHVWRGKVLPGEVAADGVTFLRPCLGELHRPCGAAMVIVPPELAP